MAFVGEQFSVPNVVTGVVFSAGNRGGDKISIWMRDGDKPALMKAVKSDIIKLLQLPHDVRIEFSLFVPEQP